MMVTYALLFQRSLCENNKGNHYTSQLFKMAPPGKFEKVKHLRDSKVHFFYPNTFLEKIQLSSKFDGKHYLLGLKLFISQSGGSVSGRNR